MGRVPMAFRFFLKRHGKGSSHPHLTGIINRLSWAGAMCPPPPAHSLIHRICCHSDNLTAEIVCFRYHRPSDKVKFLFAEGQRPYISRLAIMPLSRRYHRLGISRYSARETGPIYSLTLLSSWQDWIKSSFIFTLLPPSLKI